MTAIQASKKNIERLLILAILVCLAFIYASFLSIDSSSYQSFFQSYGSTAWKDLFVSGLPSIELFFIVLAKGLYAIPTGSYILIFLYVLFAVSLKLYLIDRESRAFEVSLFFYAAYFLLPLDGTVIRAALAISLLYWSFYLLIKGKYFYYLLVVMFCTVFVHYSSVFFLLFLILVQVSFSVIFGAIVLALLTFPLNLNQLLVQLMGNLNGSDLLSFAPFSKFYFYVTGNINNTISFSLFGFKSVLAYLAALILYFYRDSFSSFERICYKSFLVSIFVFILLKDFPVVQSRLADMFGFAFIFLVPYLFALLIILSNRFFAISAFTLVYSLLFIERMGL